MILQRPIRQIAFAVDDVREFATAHSRTFGSGPFLLRENVGMAGVLRGKQVEFRVDTAFGQWGDLQVEVMHQRSRGPGLVSEIHVGRVPAVALHHVCTIVDDAVAAAAEYESRGHELLWAGRTPAGTPVFMIDTRDVLGHFVELYEYKPDIKKLYEGVRAASAGFDGSNPVRPFEELLPGVMRQS